MLWTIFLILIILWLLGFSFDVGAFIHLLLLIALITLIVNLVRGRKL